MRDFPLPLLVVVAIAGCEGKTPTAGRPEAGAPRTQAVAEKPPERPRPEEPPPFDWSKAGGTAAVGDAEFSIEKIAITKWPAPTPPDMAIGVRVLNKSKSRVITVREWKVDSLTDEHGNRYDFRGSPSSPGWAEPVRIGPGQVGGAALEFNYPDPVSTKFRLTLDGKPFGLPGPVRLVADRPEETDRRRRK